MILTVEELNRRGACKEAVVFFERNFPNGLDLDKYQIIGEYNGWIKWLNSSLQTKFEYDDRGNKIKKIFPNRRSWQWEYDDHGNKIKEVNPNGRSWQWKYDGRGNMIKKIDPDGDIWQWEYDDRGMLIEIKENGETILEIKLK